MAFTLPPSLPPSLALPSYGAKKAIKCYEAALTTRADPPRVEAAARLAAARLMLAHTACTAEAMRHLEQARLALEGARGAGALNLKLHVCADLAACQAASGAGRAAYATLDGGAALAAAGLAPGSPDAVAWHAHFLTALGAVAAAAGDAPMAARAAGRGAPGWADPATAAAAGVSPLARAALALAAASAAASAGRMVDVEAAASAALAALDEVGGGGEGGGETGEPVVEGGAPSTSGAPAAPDPASEAWAATMRLHGETLRVGLALATGEIATLSEGLGPGAAEAVAGGLAALAGAAAAAAAGGLRAPGGPPLPTIAATVSASSAAAVGVLRPLSKFGPATVHALRGLAAADDELRRLGVLGSHFSLLAATPPPTTRPPPHKAGHPHAPPALTAEAASSTAPEASVAPHVRALAAPIIRSKLLLLEARARCALATTDLAGGRAAAAAALTLADAWPGAAAPLVPALLELAGHYALCTRCPADAARLFGAAAARAGGATGAAAAAAAPGGALPPPSTHSPATLSAGVAGPVAAQVTAGSLAALAELADHSRAGGGPTARANAALKAAGVLPDLPPDLPRAAKAVARLASGAALLAAGDESAARVSLSAALVAAENEMKNSSLVTAALVALAPSQAARGDGAGAEGMLEAAFTLAKGSLDVATQVSAAVAKRNILLASGGGGEGGEEDTGDVLAEMGAFAERKEATLQAAVERAVAGDAGEHRAVVGWGGGGWAG